MTIKVEFAANSTAHRIVYRHNRPIGYIRRDDASGKFELVTSFGQYVMLYDTYKEARIAAEMAPSTFPEVRPSKFGPQKNRKSLNEEQEAATA